MSSTVSEVLMNRPSAGHRDHEYTHAGPTWHHELVLPAIRCFLSGLPPEANVVDVGCRNGYLISRVANTGWRLYGIDSSISGIEWARRTYPQVEFVHGDAMRALTGELTAGSFDAVISVEVIEHTYDPRDMLTNLRSLLKPGGTLVLTTPYHGYLKSLAIAITGKADSHYSPLWDGGHIKFWSHRTLAAVLRECGFGDLRFADSGRVPFLWKKTIVKATKQ